MPKYIQWNCIEKDIAIKTFQSSIKYRNINTEFQVEYWDKLLTLKIFSDFCCCSWILCESDSDAVQSMIRLMAYGFCGVSSIFVELVQTNEATDRSNTTPSRCLLTRMFFCPDHFALRRCDKFAIIYFNLMEFLFITVFPITYYMLFYIAIVVRSIAPTIFVVKLLIKVLSLQKGINFCL